MGFFVLTENSRIYFRFCSGHDLVNPRDRDTCPTTL